MSKKHKAPILLTFVVVVGLLYLFISRYHAIAVLNPQGVIAQKERNLIVLTTLMSLIIVIPVFVMTFYFAWKYREGNKKSKYQPDWDHNAVAETVWWAIPAIMILILAGITWHTSHELDPFKPINSSTRPLTIQVVALDWKWLFIYPEEQIASVNYVQFPQKTPLKFEITADAPMNSFWIPKLGGQIYAMSGMSTHLNLMADNTGVYRGSSANISGRGFAGMHFTARSSTAPDFQRWVDQVRQSSEILTPAEYARLARPSENTPPNVYSSVDQHLYDTIVMKYMMPTTTPRQSVGLGAQ